MEEQTADAIDEHVAALDRLPRRGRPTVHLQGTRRERPMRRDAAQATRNRARAARLLRLVTVLSLTALAVGFLLVLLGVLGNGVLLEVIGYCLWSLLVALAVFARASMKSSRDR